MRKERFKNILKINWFIYSWKKRDRDDWYQIALEDKWYSVVDWGWNVSYSINIHELIWSLALDWIINRLF